MKAIQENKLYLRTSFGDSKVSYSGTTLQPFQGLCQGNGEAPTGWFLISWILVVYLKEKVYGVEVKTEIIVDKFKLVTMVFIDYGYFPTLGNRTYSQWGELLQQHQITVDYWIGGLTVSGVYLKPDKLSWCNIQLGWAGGNPRMISSDNAGEIHLIRRDGEQVATEELNTLQYKKVMVV